MKVHWTVSNYPNEFNPVSGNFYKRMTEALVRQGVDVTVYALTQYSNKLMATFSKKFDLYNKYPSNELINGVKVIRPRYFNFPKLQGLGISHYSMYQSIKLQSDFADCDIIDAEYAYPFGLLARLLQEKYDLPYTVNYIGDDVNIDPFVSNNARKRFLRSIEHANARISVSEELAKVAKKLSGLDSIIINHGLDLRQIEKIVVNPINKKKQTLYFLYAGELSHAKGTHFIIKLLENEEWARDEKIQWILIGQGELAQNLKKFNNVILKGLLKNEEVISYMKHSDFFVFPSQNEGMPNVLKEAGACNLPVLSSDVGGIPNLLKNGERGFMFKGCDYESFKTTLKDMIQNPDKAKNRAELLKKHIYDDYDVDVNARQLIKTYEQAIQNYKSKRNN